MPLEGEEFLGAGYLPKLHGLVPAGGGEALAIGTEGHAGDSIGMAPEGEEFLAAGRLPELHRLISAGGGEALAIGTEGQAVDTVGMSLEGDKLLAGGRVPELHFSEELFLLRIISSAGRSEALAIGTEGQA